MVEESKETVDFENLDRKIFTWIAVSIFGGALGIGAIIALDTIAIQMHWNRAAIAYDFALGGIAFFVIGFVQWIDLRRIIPNTNFWILVTTTIGSVGYVIFQTRGGYIYWIIPLIALGTCQYCLIRSRFRYAHLWAVLGILAIAVGLFCGMVLGIAAWVTLIENGCLGPDC